VPGSVVPRLGAAFSSMTSPVALVLDDVHLLHNSECRAALSLLADHVPVGSRLAFAGRDEPPLRVARLRAEGQILEIGPGDLSLTVEEAASLLRGAGVALGDDEVAVLHQRTEGWPAGLYLAALCLREGGSVARAAASFGGDDRLVSEYLEAEFLARIPVRHREFLTRTAVLEQMSAPLCEAVLGVDGSAAILARLARSNLLLVPLDHRGQWYRYHHLFRDMLLAELERLEPDMMPVLRRRAAGWCLANGRAEDAVEYSIAAGDVEAVARLVEQFGLQVYRQGRSLTEQRWLPWLEDRGGIEGHPFLAMQAAYVAAHRGRAGQAERWADAVDRWQFGDPARPADPPAEAWAFALRATFCRRGAAQMRADADEAVRRLQAAGIAAPEPALRRGTAYVLCGDVEKGDALLAEAITTGEATAAPDLLATALCQRSLLAIARGDWSRAGNLAGQARAALRRAGIEDNYATPLISAIHARLALHRGDAAAVRRELITAQRMRPLLTYAFPYLAVQARIELTRVHLALADLAAARTLMQEVDELLKRRPDLGILVSEAAALRAKLARQRGASVPSASALTGAELRLLPLLTTHLSVQEIAAELFLSPHTIKAQMRSIYRKLDATTRHRTVVRARELGLLEG
jgi:LuxR family maltose regulon positive regulatory protein